MRDLSFWGRVWLAIIGALLLALVVPSAMDSSRALAQPSSATSSHAKRAAAMYYDSFAYAIAERVAVVSSGTNPDNARAAAESTCRHKGGGADCQSVGWFTDASGSFALGPGNQWGWGTGTSRQEAASLALKYCGSGCQLVKPLQVAIGGSSFAWGTGTPLRGDWHVGGFTEGVGDHVGRDYWAVDFFSNATAVYPTQAGEVVFAGYSCKPNRYPCYGNVVAIYHGNGLYSIYTHLASTGLPSTGEQVTPSTRIGTMSDSGCPPSVCGTPIHLHYAMRSGPAGLTGELALYSNSLGAVRTPWHK
jgi:murein DD-endopeptidase MepM/ murein hydrolase activator NlpD